MALSEKLSKEFTKKVHYWFNITELLKSLTECLLKCFNVANIPYQGLGAVESKSLIKDYRQRGKNHSSRMGAEGSKTLIWEDRSKSLVKDSRQRGQNPVSRIKGREV